MAEQQSGVPKPPPLHKRSDALDDIVAEYSGGNNLMSVQDTFRGALRMIRGTAVPKEHDELSTSISTDATLIGLENDPLVAKTLTWITSEKERHEKEAEAKAATEAAQGTGRPDFAGVVETILRKPETPGPQSRAKDHPLLGDGWRN